jgi:UDP-glucose 4-epimerase
MRSAELSELLKAHRVDCVVHLASVVNPPKGMSLHDQYSIDVDGTHNVVESCLTADVNHLIVTSSGAAYGYHADNPVPLREEHPLRGNDAFAYARHKRLIEESLARYREFHPELRQLVFRPGTILGVGTHNQITDLFERSVQVGVLGAVSPFCFVLDEDVAACIVKGVHERRTGVFNLTGDGVMTASEIARCTGARRLLLPAAMMRGAVRSLRALQLTKYGPEQVLFLQYRPVLANDALKTAFGFAPTMTSREVFELWWKSRAAGK